MTNLPSSRKEALKLGSKFYFTGNPCKNNHIDKRVANDGVCVACRRQYANSYYQVNKKLVTEKLKERRKTDVEYREKLVKRARSYRQKPLAKEKRKEYSQVYRLTNREHLTYRQSLRRACQLKATPKWVDLNEIALVYEHRSYVSRLTGVLHHVDHTVPLKNPVVCGLHVPWNLQILTAEENIRKQNRIF